MKDIATAMGMVPGNLYRYIKTKDDILHLICIDSTSTINSLYQVLISLTHKTYKKNLEQCIRVYINISNGDDWSKRNLFFNREIRYFDHDDRQILLQSQKDFIELFRNLIADGVEHGEFYSKNPLLLAHHIVLLPHNWILRRWFLSNHFTFAEYIEQNIELIMNSLQDPNNGVKEEREILESSLGRRMEDG
jgi:AcrR family transcriptional regulator